MSNRVLCVIPARIGSTRLPRKPLQKINGKTIIQMTYQGAKTCPEIDKVVVATDDEEIKAVIEEIGGEVVMTDPSIKTGSDRVAAVAKEKSDYEIVINLQGDEPFIRQEMLSKLVMPFRTNSSATMATLAFPLVMATEYDNPDLVKVICDKQSRAIYFSRSPIPYLRVKQGLDLPVYHHMGVYAFTRDFLLHYTTLPQTPLELSESLEQLRAIEHGYRIHVNLVENRTLEINTPEELAKAQEFDRNLT